MPPQDDVKFLIPLDAPEEPEQPKQGPGFGRVLGAQAVRLGTGALGSAVSSIPVPGFAQAVGGVIGGLGEGAAELIEGTPLSPTRIITEGVISGIPAVGFFKKANLIKNMVRGGLVAEGSNMARRYALGDNPMPDSAGDIGMDLLTTGMGVGFGGAAAKVAGKEGWRPMTSINPRSVADDVAEEVPIPGWRPGWQQENPKMSQPSPSGDVDKPVYQYRPLQKGDMFGQQEMLNTIERHKKGDYVSPLEHQLIDKHLRERDKGTGPISKALGIEYDRNAPTPASELDTLQTKFAKDEAKIARDADRETVNRLNASLKFDKQEAATKKQAENARRIAEAQKNRVAAPPEITELIKNGDGLTLKQKWLTPEQVAEAEAKAREKAAAAGRKATQEEMMRSFIEKAEETYGIKPIGASGSISGSVKNPDGSTKRISIKLGQEGKSEVEKLKTIQALMEEHGLTEQEASAVYTIRAKTEDGGSQGVSIRFSRPKPTDAEQDEILNAPHGSGGGGSPKPKAPEPPLTKPGVIPVSSNPTIERGNEKIRKALDWAEEKSPTPNPANVVKSVEEPPAPINRAGMIFSRQPQEVNAKRFTPEVRQALEEMLEELDDHPNSFVDELNEAGGNASTVKGKQGKSQLVDRVRQIAPLAGKRSSTNVFSRKQLKNAIQIMLGRGDVHNYVAEGALQEAEERVGKMATGAADDLDFNPSLFEAEPTAQPAVAKAPTAIPVAPTAPAKPSGLRVSPGMGAKSYDIPQEALDANPELAALAEQYRNADPGTASELRRKIKAVWETHQGKQGLLAKAEEMKSNLAGEQPTLPETGAVRATENATPEVADAPFSLTGGADTTPQGAQQGLRLEPEAPNPVRRLEDEQGPQKPVGAIPAKGQGATPKGGLKVAPEASNAPEEAFLREFHDSSMGNPLGSRERLLTDTPNDLNTSFAGVELSSAGPGRVHLSMVRSLEKGKGLGRKAMEKLTALADKHGVTIEGIAKPVGKDGLKSKALKDFYKKFGFTVKGDSIERPPSTPTGAGKPKTWLDEPFDPETGEINPAPPKPEPGTSIPEVRVGSVEDRMRAFMAQVPEEFHSDELQEAAERAASTGAAYAEAKAAGAPNKGELGGIAQKARREFDALAAELSGGKAKSTTVSQKPSATPLTSEVLESPVFTPEELAKKLNVNVKTIRRAYESGQLKYSRNGRKVIITKDQFDEWLKKRSERGEISPEMHMLMMKATYGLMGGALGSLAGANLDEEDPRRGMILGGLAGLGLGIGAPALVKSAQKVPDLMGNIHDTSHQGAKRFVNIMQGGMLAEPDSMAINSWLAPWGAGMMGGIEDVLSGNVQEGMEMLRRQWNPIKWGQSWVGNLKRAGEHMDQGRVDVDTTSPGARIDRAALIPAQAMTAGDMTTSDNMVAAGVDPERAQRITLVGEPWSKTGAGFLNFAKASPYTRMLLPFSRTAVNVLESGFERTPLIGFYAQLKKEAATGKMDPELAQIAQQGLGGAVFLVGYILGETVDPETDATWKIGKMIQNSTGQYSLLASAGFAAGRARQRGENQTSAIVKDVFGNQPLPSTQVPLDIVNTFQKALEGEVPHPQQDWVHEQWMPRSVIPGFAKKQSWDTKKNQVDSTLKMLGQEPYFTEEDDLIQYLLENN